MVIHGKTHKLNDFDGTLNSNAKLESKKKKKKGSEDGVNKYYERQKKQFDEFKNKTNNS